MALLERSDTELVVGSKAMVGSNDQRPLFRRMATRVYNGMLRVVCRFPGTDTHGLKAFRRDALLETARRCVLDRDVFASEFVIRAAPRGEEGRRDPVRRAREAAAVDPPGQARAARREERRQAGDLGPPQRRLIGWFSLGARRCGGGAATTRRGGSALRAGSRLARVVADSRGARRWHDCCFCQEPAGEWRWASGQVGGGRGWRGFGGGWRRRR